jgi:hypothetical protein
LDERRMIGDRTNPLAGVNLRGDSLVYMPLVRRFFGAAYDCLTL